MTQLRLVSPRQQTPFETSPTISKVPSRMLPILSLEEYRDRQILRQMDIIRTGRPLAYAVLVKLISRTCARCERVG